MRTAKGMIVLMGSGELTSTMVEVYKEILARLGGKPKAVFLDTPAGFQLNADQLSQRAVDYFQTRVGHPMSVASLKSSSVPPLDAAQAYRTLRDADLVLVGPGSPTYALKQWRQTPVPEILMTNIETGKCLIAASAAALTVGQFTVPVYEIYKVGEEPRWAEGMDITGHFGFRLVIIPHWNNAEGGTHDTRFCFIGESRYMELSRALPPDTGIMGIDEHTACIIDLANGHVQIKGIGTVTLRFGSSEQVLRRDHLYPLSVLLGTERREAAREAHPVQQVAPAEERTGENIFWDAVHGAEKDFDEGLRGDVKNAVNALLELDRLIWKAKQDLESEESISQARDALREMIVLLGTHLSSAPANREECLGPLIQQLIMLRERFRSEKKWDEADRVRDCLNNSGIILEDTPEGTQWRLAQ